MSAMETGLAALLRRQDENDRFLRYCSVYLNEAPDLVRPEAVDELCRDCGIAPQEAVCAILSAAFGLEPDTDPADRALERDYLRLSMTRLDPAAFREDAYLRCVRIPRGLRFGDWEFREQIYAPYEGFVWRESLRLDDGRELPQLGYFDVPYAFPGVFENGVEWMAVKPNEQETMRAPLAAAHGRVLTLGLGLGYFAFHASEKPEVESVSVLERSPRVIDLFATHLLPQFPHREKIRVVQGDAFALLPGVLPGADFVFADLWHDVSDGLGLYIRLRRLEEQLEETKPWQYWIESSLLSRLRGMVLDACARGETALRGDRTIREQLTDRALRALAAKMKPQ